MDFLKRGVMFSWCSVAVYALKLAPLVFVIGWKLSRLNLIFDHHSTRKKSRRTKHLEQRHKMMQHWSDYLDGLQVDNVVVQVHV